MSNALWVVMTDPETIALRVTVIGGQTYADDFTVIWREMLTSAFDRGELQTGLISWATSAE